jgi:exosortase
LKAAQTAQRPWRRGALRSSWQPNRLAAIAGTRALEAWRAISAAELSLLLAIAALVIPTLVSLATEYWTGDNGAHGPIILASAFWLFWRERRKLKFQPGSMSGIWLAAFLPPLLLLYAYGRTFDVLFAESAALYAILVLLGLFYLGPRTMRRLWFAVLYAGFLIKPPSGLVAEFTQPLKIWLSETAVNFLHMLDYPVGNTGVSIQIAQYELLVQQACAGLGSIFTLLAICLLYLHVTKPSDRVRSIVLLASIVPIAVGANLLRVTLLILLTYHAGTGVAQGIAHDFAGLITFVVALGGMMAVDALLERARMKS